MAKTVTSVLTEATDILLDSGMTRWTQAELIRWLNAARREIAIFRPDIYSVTYVATLVAGTKQTIPADGNGFLDATRNIASNGTTAGRAVRIIEREILDAHRPDWHTETAASAVKHFMFDEREPRTFYVYPPVVAGTNLEIKYSKTPVELINSDSLNEDELYSSAIVDYILYRAFSKDAEYTGNMARATTHYAAFANALGVGLKNKLVASPNTANIGGAVPRVGAAAQA